MYNLWYEGKHKCRVIAEEAGKYLIEFENGKRGIVWKNKISRTPTFNKQDHIKDLLCPHCGYLNQRDSSVCYDCEKEIKEND